MLVNASYMALVGGFAMRLFRLAKPDGHHDRANIPSVVTLQPFRFF